jgi:hypothetical protein
VSGDAQHTRTEAAESRSARTPFPRYERIGEELADEPRDVRDVRELEIPHTESPGELYARIARRGLRR